MLVKNIRYAFTLQYLGGNYSGYQIQKNRRSIQEEVEKAITTVLRERVRIHTAGRTDQGVHAIALVIHFETSHEHLNLHEFIYSVNAILSKDISLIYGSRVPNSFHARFSCISREYIYKIINMPYRPSIDQNAYWVWGELDIESVKKAIFWLIGEKDFTSFAKTNFLKFGQKTIRKIEKINVIQKGAAFFFIIKARAFCTI